MHRTSACAAAIMTVGRKYLPSVAALLLAAALLLGADLALENVGAANAQRERLHMLRTLLPGSDTFVREDYAGDDANITAVYRGEGGCVVETRTRGYAGDIAMLVGVSDAGMATGLVVRQLRETRGLGARALRDRGFLAQFLNTAGDATVGVNVDTIAGATVTSRAVARGVNSAVAFVTGADTASQATPWGG